MATSGTITGTTSNQYIDSKIMWTSVTNEASNSSTVTASLYYRRNNEGFTTSGTGSFFISIDGEGTTVTKTMNIGQAWVLAVSWSRTVSHNNDGTKKVEIYAGGSIPDTTLKSTDCEATVTLNTIPRASTITSASDIVLGNPCNIKWTPLSASFRYKISYTIGGFSYTTGAIHPNTTSAYTYYSNDLTLSVVANHITTSSTGTMTATLYTYSDSGATKQVGSASSKTFTVYVPQNTDTKPALSMTLTPVTSAASNFGNVYIQGYSKVDANFSASGKYGATVSSASYSMSVHGKTYSSPYTSDYLSQSGTFTVTGSCTDSRGFTGTAEQEITVIPYFTPKVVPVDGESQVICARCDANGNLRDSGTYLKIKAKRSYSKCADENGSQRNFCGLRYRYKHSSASDYSDWITLLGDNVTGTDEVITGALLGGSLLATDSYVVQVDAVDSIPNHTTMTFTIPTDKIYMHKAGSIRSLGIGEYVEDDNTVSIAEDIAVKVKNSINGVFMAVKSVSGVSSFDIQTKYSEFSESVSGNERQTFFLFGADNSALVYGLARVSNKGAVLWEGTSGVTLSTKAGGILTVNLPTTAYDMFTVISCRKFTL